MSERPTTTTSITWPPARETHLITAVINGTVTIIPAYLTADTSLFPNYTFIPSSTKPPPTTVIGKNPPPPLINGAPASTNSGSDDGQSSAILWRNWGLVVLGIVVLALTVTLFLKRYRKGRPKKQEPGNFVTVGEDDGEGEVEGVGGGGGVGTGGGGRSGGETNNISLATLGGHHHHHHHQNQIGVANNVRERRNSQPIPRVLDLSGGSRP